MHSRVVDHSVSERRLNRVLYVLKYLRALPLHYFWMFAAVALFAATGRKGLYFFADLTIAGLAAQQGVVDEQGVARDVLVGIMVVGMFGLAGVAWVYSSIRKVRRYSLRVQAAIAAAAALSAGRMLWTDVALAFENLSTGFSLLFALFVVMMAALLLDIAVALWLVSGSPDASSFVATLDPRLAPGWWAFLNKVMDLPRAPWRSARMVGAYAVAFCAGVLLTVSTVYLLTVGAVANTFWIIKANWNTADVAGLVGHSHDRALWIPVFLGVSLLAAKSSLKLQDWGRELGQSSVAEIMKDPAEPFVLYLRPFDTDDVVLPKPKLPVWSRLLSFRPPPPLLEQELFDVADGYRWLIAVGNPEKKGSEGGGIA